MVGYHISVLSTFKIHNGYDWSDLAAAAAWTFNIAT